MKVWKDILSGDEFVSDSYPFQELYEGACLEVKSRLITKKDNEDFGIGANADEDGNDEGVADANAVTVIDIVDSFRLKEITLDKKGWTGYIKEFLKRVKGKLEEAGQTERIPVFQKGATELVKFILSKFDEIQIFAGESYDMDAGLAYCYYKEQTDAGPTFLFFLDSLKEEKY